MRINDLLQENMPRTLYHGTLKSNLPDILDHGLLPQIGEFTKHAYQEYVRAGIPLEHVIFAADRRGIGKCVSAIIGQLRHQNPIYDRHHAQRQITADEFYQHAALLVLKNAEPRFYHRDEHDPYGSDHAPQVEPGDYYHHGADMPDFVLTGKKLANFLRRNDISLMDYGIAGSSADQAERKRRSMPQPSA